MKRTLIAATLFFVPVAAFAQDTKPDLVLIPREVAVTALNWIGEPNPTIAVKLYSALSACIQDNPSGGTMARTGSDQCSVVTAAIDARDKELADLRKQLADAKKPAQEPK